MILNSIKLGLELVKKSPILIIWAFILSVPLDTLLVLVKGQTGFNNVLINLVVYALNIFIFFLSFGYYFVLPKLLIMRQEGVKLQSKIVFQETLKTTKKIFLPLILIGFLAFIFFIVLILLTYAVFGLEQLTQVWEPVFIAFILILGLFSFAPILYSIEKYKFLKANIKSVPLALKNIDFILIISLPFVLPQFVYQQFLVNKEWGPLVTWPFYTIWGLIVSAAVLYFYQSKKKPE